MRNDDKIKYWFTTEKGVHVPVREGQSKEEALKERFSEPKFEKVGLLDGMGGSHNGYVKTAKAGASAGYENEMILQRGLQYRITKTEKAANGKYYIDMEVLQQ